MGKFVAVLFVLCLCRLSALSTNYPKTLDSENNFSGLTLEESVTTDGTYSSSAPKIKISRYFGTPGPFQYFYLGVGALGMVANLMVLVVLFASKNLLSSYTNKFIANQSLIDFFASFFIATTNSLREIAPEALGDGLAQEMYCRIWVTRVPLWGTLISSTWNLVALTFERYYGIVYPLHHAQHFTNNKAYILMAAAWVLGVGYQASRIIPTAKSINRVCINNQYPNGITYEAITIFSICLQYVIPLVAITFAYIHIFIKLRGISYRMTDGVVNQYELRMRRVRKNVVLTLFKVFACFVVCWTPNQVIFMAQHLGFELTKNLSYYHSSVLLVFFNCCINPVVYSLTYTAFQEAQRAIFCCSLRSKSASDQGEDNKGKISSDIKDNNAASSSTHS